MYDRHKAHRHDPDDYPYPATPVRRRRRALLPRQIFNANVMLACIPFGISAFAFIVAMLLGGQELVDAIDGLRFQMTDGMRAWREYF